LSITKKDTEIIIHASEKVGLGVHSEKTKYMLMSRHQNKGQNHNIKIGNRCFKNVDKFRYFGTTVTNLNLIHEEIKSRLISSDACYHSVHNPLSSSLLSKKVKTKIYKTIILPFVLYGCKTVSDIKGRT
jgi:hypothetical protein